MKLLILISLVLMMTVAAHGQAQWHKLSSEDPFTNKKSETFVMVGKYLTPPNNSMGQLPTFGISCSGGKFAGALLITGAVVAGDPSVNVRIDDGKPFRIIGAVSQDYKSIMFLWGREVKKILLGHKAMMGAFEYPNNSSIIMEFEVPDPAEIFTACGKL